MPRDIFLRACSPPEANYQMNSMTPAGATIPNAHGASSRNGEQSLRFLIKNIMYSFGDVKTPLDLSVDSVVGILGEQMQIAYRLASVYPEKRGKNEVEVLDLVFIYRKDSSMLHRIYRRVETCVQAMRLQQAAQAKFVQKVEDKLIDELSDAFQRIGDQKLIDVLDESYVDSLRQERLAYMAERTKLMDQEEYLEFHSARGVSFASSASSRKILFDHIDKNTDWKMSNNARELLAMIAYEIVAKLTEAAVAIRSMKNSRNEDDFLSSTIGRQYNPDFASNNPLFNGYCNVEQPTMKFDFLKANEPLQHQEVTEALFRLQECRKPVFCSSEISDWLRMI